MKQQLRWLGKWVVAVVVLGGIGAAGWYASARGKSSEHASPKGDKASVTAEVIAPKPGGIDRTCSQPGTVEPFESADLYAKVSGYLIEQKVDIGSVVKVNDVLARLAAPEHEKQVQKDAADVQRAEAKRNQSLAAIATSEADMRAASSAVALAQAEQKSKTSYRAYRAKQRERLRELLAQRAIDAKLVDEQEDQYEAALSAELAAEESVNATKQKAAAAQARVEQAKADQQVMVAEVAVAKAQLERSTVLLDYAVIRSPYDGVITRRTFNRGDFVRSADSGGDRQPMLSVERTDMMRLVVQVPDRDVPFVNAGDPASVEFDAIPGGKFFGPGGKPPAISRAAESEDPRSRMMRTEIDLLNQNGKLRRGMYGKVFMNLQVGETTAVRIPSAALLTRADGGKGTVRVVRDGVVRTIPVLYGSDNGVEAEILTGVTAADRVVVRVSGTADDGTTVNVAEAHSSSGSSGH